MSTGRKLPVRAKVVALTGTVVTFRCPTCQREWDDDLNSRKLKRSRRIGPMGAAIIVRHWQGTGGPSMQCPFSFLHP